MKSPERLVFFAGTTQRLEALAPMSGRLAALRRHKVGEEELQLLADLISFTALEDAADIDLLLFILAGLQAAVHRGSTRLALESDETFDLEDFLQDVSSESEKATITTRLAAARDLLGRPELAPLIAHDLTGDTLAGARPLVFDGRHLHRERDIRLETGLAKRLAARLRDEEGDAPTPSLSGPTLSREQEAAVSQALHRSLSCVSGGPGTGKTTLVAALILGAIQQGLSPEDLALAAPTGKAAYRMGQALRQEWARFDEGTEIDAASIPARTLHQLLGYDPRRDRFRRHRGHPIEAELVIVDEASMIDLTTMERLLQALRPEARLVLIGDADQLPAVESGAVFRDLTGHHSFRLTENFRQKGDDPGGRAILEVAAAVREGEAVRLLDSAAEDASKAADQPEPAALQKRRGVSDLAWSGVELVESSEDGELDALLAQWFHERLDLVRDFPELFRSDGRGATDFDITRQQALLSRHEGFRIVSATRVLPRGTEAINRRLRQYLARALGVSAREPFLPGEPVVITRNDPRRRLFNGDQGVAVPRHDAGTGDRGLEIVFEREGSLAAFSPSALQGRLESGFATTVHKSQGSEFLDVLFVLPADLRVSLGRELVYTAITRARRSVVLAGKAEVLKAAIERGDRRDCGLKDLLLAALDAG